MMRIRLLAVAASLVVSLASPAAQQGAASSSPLAVSPFEAYLELLRQQAGIPGLSAAILQNGEIVWERGFGFQNLEARVRATPDTPYPIGDLSEIVAATLVLQCAEEHRLSIDDPAEKYGASLPDQGVTIRQLLGHTSAPPPGDSFRYDPSRFAQLTPVIESCIPQPYRKTVAVRILERLAMKDSVPGRDVQDPIVAQQNLFGTAVQQRYTSVLERLATPYKVDRKGRASRTELPAETLTAASGLVSTVRDLARLDAALEANVDPILRQETRLAAWTNNIGRDRTPIPTGLGWFVQRYNGEPVVWQFGQITNGYSSLLVKLPARRLTLILLANSDGLAASFDLQSGDAMKSLFAVLFLRLFA
jgi:CubicO group peptidase (beta-lactamase class C family)